LLSQFCLSRFLHNALSFHLPRMETFLHTLMQTFALPQYGLSTVFVVAFVSATLLPIGSEAAVYGLVALNPGLFWPTMLVATLGNTLGGAVSWWMGLGAHKAVDKMRDNHKELRALAWLQQFGPKACFLSFLPVIGDPLCAVAGWLKMPFWNCLLWMAVGKFLRYVALTALLLWVLSPEWVAKVLQAG
jgi:membrane protein YqaA with SNARE-associated domain